MIGRARPPPSREAFHLCGPMVESTLHCPKCDYNLTGLTENRCPECGEPFDPEELSHLALARKPIRGSRLILLLIWPAFVFAGATIAVELFRLKREPEIYGAAFIAMMINTGFISKRILAGTKRRTGMIPYSLRRSAVETIAFVLLLVIQLVIAIVITFGAEMGSAWLRGRPISLP